MGFAHPILPVLTIVTTAILSCCTGTGTPANATEMQAVTLQFQARVDSQPFHCDQRYTLGTSASSVTPMDFRFYMSYVALIDAARNATPLTLEQDERWQYESVALLDFEDKSGGCTNGTVEMNDRIVGTVPAGEYVGLRFTVGVPFELNHGDATSAKRGESLFHSERLECFHGHGGLNFSDSIMHERLAFQEIAFHNTRLYNIDGNGAYRLRPHTSSL